MFIYENKFYRQIIGGATGSAFILTLANIFMWKWEKELVQRQLVSNGIYGRYIGGIFFTSSEPLNRINQMLDEANNLHPNINLVRQIGKSVSFLDLLIENKDDVLATSVYHKEEAESYLVPFNSDHPQYVFTNIIDGALMRAIRYSSKLSTLDEERRPIKLMLLYNGYPPRYIHNRFTKFFTNHFKTSSLQPTFDNIHNFEMHRSYLLTRPTITEHHIASRIANVMDK